MLCNCRLFVCCSLSVRYLVRLFFVFFCNLRSVRLVRLAMSFVAPVNDIGLFHD